MESQEKKHLGFIVDVVRGTAEPCHFRSVLADYYRLLRCELIDICEVMIEGRRFDFIVDDEGLLKGPAKPSAFSSDQKPLFAGSILVCHNDPETGLEIGLTNDEISLLLSKVVQVSTGDGEKYKGLIDVKM